MIATTIGAAVAFALIGQTIGEDFLAPCLERWSEYVSADNGH
jgi:hypothetical protein